MPHVRHWELLRRIGTYINFWYHYWFSNISGQRRVMPRVSLSLCWPHCLQCDERSESRDERSESRRGRRWLLRRHGYCHMSCCYKLCCYKVYCNKVLLHGATRCVARNHFEVFKGVTKVFRGQTGSNTPGRPSNRVKYEFSQGPPL